MSQLPKFKYYKNPYTEGSIENEEYKCSCCRNKVSHVYEHSKGEFCPWCIANGNAAKKFNIFFNELNNIPNNIPEAVINELTKNTPGYSSWQNKNWIFHCADACIFEGDLEIEEINSPVIGAVKKLMSIFNIEEDIIENWKEMTQFYEVGNPSIFKFSCRHCNEVFYQIESP